MSGMFDMMNSARLGTGCRRCRRQAAPTVMRQLRRERLAGRAAKAEDRTGGTADTCFSSSRRTSG